MKSQEQTPRLLDQVRNVMRLHHYSIHTERSYTDWIKRYIHFHHMRRREDLANGESKIETFLTDLAVNGKVAPSTQNQAMNALVFLYRQVLKAPLDEKIDAVRADRKVNVPVVLTREEVAKVVSLLDGVSAVCAGTEVSQCGQGVGLAVSVSGARLVNGPLGRRAAAPPCGSERGQQGHQGGGAAGGPDEGGECAHLQAQFRHAPPPAGYGHPHYSGAAGPYGRGHHDDLYPCAAARWPRGAQSTGRSDAVNTEIAPRRAS